MRNLNRNVLPIPLRLPGPPDLQRREVPVPDRLLPPRMSADPPDREIDFD